MYGIESILRCGIWYFLNTYIYIIRVFRRAMKLLSNSLEGAYSNPVFDKSIDWCIRIYMGIYWGCRLLSDSNCMSCVLFECCKCRYLSAFVLIDHATNTHTFVDDWFVKRRLEELVSFKISIKTSKLYRYVQTIAPPNGVEGIRSANSLGKK